MWVRSGVRGVQVQVVREPGISPCNQPTKITDYAACVQPGPRMLLVNTDVQTASMPRQLRLDRIACRFGFLLHTCTHLHTRSPVIGVCNSESKNVLRSPRPSARSSRTANVTTADSQVVPLAVMYCRVGGLVGWWVGGSVRRNRAQTGTIPPSIALRAFGLSARVFCYSRMAGDRTGGAVIEINTEPRSWPPPLTDPAASSNDC